MKLLLVEDSAHDANLIQDIINLKFNKADITQTDTLKEGLVKLAGCEFDLIILDLGLPDSDGLSTLLAVKEASDTPIVILTGNDNEALGVSAVGSGAQDYIIKGTEPEQLCRSIKYAIQRNLRINIKTQVKKPKEHFSNAISKLTNIIDTLNQSSNPAFDQSA